MKLDKSTCLGEILNDRDFEIVEHYVQTGKIMEGSKWANRRFYQKETPQQLKKI